MDKNEIEFYQESFTMNKMKYTNIFSLIIKSIIYTEMKNYVQNVY